MKRFPVQLPTLITLPICVLLILHGPIDQFPHYHEFADNSVFLGIPHAADVLSNLGFAIVAIWGLMRLWPKRDLTELKAGWHGYSLFLAGLLLTAVGSSFYHWAPDNFRLVFDRLPIALACAGLLAAVRAEVLSKSDSRIDAILLGIFAVISVGWWFVTDQLGIGDLRPYLLLQGLPLVLIPLWQMIYRSPYADRGAFGIALLLYVVAKLAEIYDHQLLIILGVISGHTLKHILATAAAAVLIARLVRRAQGAPH